MKKWSVILVVLVTIFGIAQLIRPKEISNRPLSDLKNVPKDVNDVLRSSCFDCHSSETNLKWFDRITPANFLVNGHVLAGRKALDFSGWDTLTTSQQNNILSYALNKILEGEMPLPSYSFIHRDSKLSPKDINLLKQFLLSRTPRKVSDTAQLQQSNISFEQLQQNKAKHIGKQVVFAPNGIAYISDYRNWHAISSSDRFDNGTMRIIFANDIAVKAIQNKQTNPWPDDAVFAKTAWKQQVNADGSVTTGAFVQVEFMIKDSHKYAKTKGWGWARWRGNDLQPYGKDALFTAECISCHQPVENNDFVFTQPLNLHSLIAQSK